MLMAGCEGTGGLSQLREASRAGAGLDLTAPVRTGAVERDVPAPEVFSQTDRGLWDGRPSLGGIWVAHAAARDPERVLIRNTATGAEVIGALFRRERENPGPRFQISSEAASELGILAGQPAEIEVIALRLERIEPERSRPAARDEASGASEASEAPALPADTGAAPQAPRAETAAAEALPEPAAAAEVALVDEAPARRGLRDLFRRRPADDAPVIGEAPLPPIGSAEPETAAAPETEIAAAQPAPPPAAQTATQPSIRPQAAERPRRIRPGAEPLAGTAFLSAQASEPAPVRRAGAQAQSDRPRLRDLFRRQPAAPAVDDTLIPLPAETD